MLHYTNGIIEELIRKKNQFDENNLIEESSQTISSSKTSPYILRVTDFFQLQYEYYAVHLSDESSKTIVAIVDLDQYNEQTSSIDADKTLKIQTNCSIIVNEINFVVKSNFNEIIQNMLPKDESRSFFVLSKATVIAADTKLNNKKLDANNSTTLHGKTTSVAHSLNESQNDESTLDSIDVVNISDLNKTKHSKGMFMMKLWLCEKTNIEPFNTKRKQTAKSSKLKLRFKFADESGFIEAVTFDALTEKYKSLQVKRWYLLKNIYLQYTPRHFHSWPAEITSSDLDIVLNDETCIEQIKNNIRPPSKPTLKELKQTESSKKRLPNSSSNLNMNQNEIDEKRICVETSIKSEPSALVLKSAASYNDSIEFTFTPLNMLPILDSKAVVNVYGYVTKIINVEDYVRYDDMSKFELKHVYIKDESLIETRCAFWGKQATDFKYKEGTVLLLRDVELTRYEGITLNILRLSGVIEITSEYNYSFYNDLIKLYLNKS